MNDDFTPTHIDDETGLEIHYRQGFPFAMRDTGLYRSDDICVVVLGDIADCMEDANLPGASEARATYEQARGALAEYDQENGEHPDWILDASFYPPEGVDVDWNGEAGTVTVTVDAGWPDLPSDDYIGKMVDGYVTCAIWTGLDWGRCDRWDEEGHGPCSHEHIEHGNPAALDENYGKDDISPAAADEIVRECREFATANYADLLTGWDAGQAGHDFHLTRNGHGAGFWDRYNDATPKGKAGRRLTDAAHVYGTSELQDIGDGTLGLSG